MGRKKRAIKKKPAEEVKEKPKIDSKLIIGALILVAVLFFAFKGGTEDGGTQGTLAPVQRVAGEYEFFENMANTHEAGKVKMAVFFDFYCPHCYNFDTGLLTQLEDKYGSQLEVTSIGYPIFGQKAVDALRSFEMAKDLGEGEEMKIALFMAYHDQDKDISDTAVLADIAGEVGLNRDAFKESLDSGAKSDSVQLNIDLAEKYNLKQTPTVVLDGQYVVTDCLAKNSFWSI
jgi:predicted DsbA family dithiol-disulfide isomerase